MFEVKILFLHFLFYIILFYSLWGGSLIILIVLNHSFMHGFDLIVCFGGREGVGKGKEFLTSHPPPPLVKPLTLFTSILYS